MSETSQFIAYRSVHNNVDSHGFEVIGIPDGDLFASILNDTQTITLPLGSNVVPVMWPMSVMPDRNIEYYQQLATASGQPIDEIWYYDVAVGSAANLEDHDNVVAPVLRQIAANNGLLAYDCIRSDAERSDATVCEIIRRAGAMVCRQVVGMPEHHDYITLLELPNPSLAPKPMNFPALYQEAVDSGALANDSNAVVTGLLSSRDCDAIAKYYGERHAALTATDATNAGFSDESLGRILRDPAFTKIAYIVGGHIANVTILAHPRDCSWIDQKMFTGTYPNQYEDGRTVVVVGAISDPAAEQGLSLRTFGIAAKLMAFAGGNIVLAFATDGVSNAYIPKLSQLNLKRAGFTVHLEEQPTGMLFKALLLSADSTPQA